MKKIVFSLISLAFFISTSAQASEVEVGRINSINNRNNNSCLRHSLPGYSESLFTDGDYALTIDYEGNSRATYVGLILDSGRYIKITDTIQCASDSTTQRPGWVFRADDYTYEIYQQVQDPNYLRLIVKNNGVIIVNKLLVSLES